MHEIHKIIANGGEKFASFANGVTGDDTNGRDTSTYVNKLKEANGHSPVKSRRLPPAEQSTRSANEIDTNKTAKEKNNTCFTEKYQKLLQNYEFEEENNKSVKSDISIKVEVKKEEIQEEEEIEAAEEKKKEIQEEEEEIEAAESHNFPLLDVYDIEEEEHQQQQEQAKQSEQQEEEFTVVLGDSDSGDDIELSQISDQKYTIILKNQEENSNQFLNSEEESVKIKPRLLNGSLRTLTESPNERLKRKYSESKLTLKKYRRLINNSLESSTSSSSSSADEDSQQERFDEKSLKKFIKSLTKKKDKKKRRKSQMGLNIFSKLREIFSFKKNDTQEEIKRKRRISDQSSGSEYNPHIKYRRVENKFPKYVESTIDKDTNDLMFTHNSHMMTEQNKPKLRKSIFAVPKTTRKLVRNSSVVNVELPNIDDDIQLPDNTSTSRLTYAQVLRQSMSHQNNIDRSQTAKMCGNGYVLGTRTSNNLPTNVASTSTTYPLKSVTLPLNPLLTQQRTMLSEQKQREDHNNYKKLLRRVQNAEFGSENATPVLKPTRNTNLFDTASSRRSLSINGAISKPRPLVHSFRNKHTETLNSIDLTDDDDDDDVEFTSVLASSSMNQQKPKKAISICDLVNERDDDVVEVIDLADEQQQSLVKNKSKTLKLPPVEQVNTLFDRIHSTPAVSDNWMVELKSKYLEQKKLRELQLAEYEKLTSKLSEERREAELSLQQRLRNFQIIDPDCFVVDEFPESDLEDETEPRLKPLTEEHHDIIKRALQGPPDQVLVNKFNLSITRRDIHTLQGLNWLNDEVINFYMNLLTERSEKKKELPAVYAMNTFFVQRLLQNGHGGVKRWTRKVDIFSKELIPVPVHVGGVHWCMAIINLKEKSIKYYDSMGSPNPTVLRALAQYLRDESMDKRKQPYDTSKFHIESVQDVPRQMNGSDCGVFSCMFAEFVTRNCSITFSQQHMEYFRYKMIVEIVQGELLH